MNKIKALRQAEGITQKELAALLGVKQNTLSTWETGRYEPDGEMLIKIAAHFNTTTDYLLGHGTKKEPTTVPGDGQAEKLAAALRGIGIDVDNLSDADVTRIAKLAKAAFDD